MSDDLATIRSYWEFAAVSQFLHLFFEAFHLTEFSTETLEEHLLSSWTPPELTDLHIKMLKVLTQNRFINLETWQMYFRREVLKRYTANDIFPEDLDYANLPLRNKVLVLHCLCEWQFDYPDRFKQAVKNEDECNHWRVDPVGWDAAGNIYWLFDDNRLYKEEITVKKKKGRPSKGQEFSEPAGKWTLQCLTLEDWKNFPEKFRNSRNQAERTFYEFLTLHALPQVLPDLEHAIQEKEKQRKLEEALANRKRSSRLQMREVQRLEEERISLMERDRLRKERRNEGGDISTEDDYDDFDDSRRLRRRKVNPEPPKVDPVKLREDRLRRRSGHTGVDQVMASEQSYVASERSSRKKKTPEPEYKSVKESSPHWYFSCTCGMKGQDLDDGNPMTACGRCSQWQHLRCAAISEGLSPDVSAEEWEDREFLCVQCRKEVSAATDVLGDGGEHKDIKYDQLVAEDEDVGHLMEDVEEQKPLLHGDAQLSAFPSDPFEPVNGISATPISQ